MNTIQLGEWEKGYAMLCTQPSYHFYVPYKRDKGLAEGMLKNVKVIITELKALVIDEGLATLTRIQRCCAQLEKLLVIAKGAETKYNDLYAGKKQWK